jgi:hypothetical protein
VGRQRATGNRSIDVVDDAECMECIHEWRQGASRNNATLGCLWQERSTQAVGERQAILLLDEQQVDLQRACLWGCADGSW